MFSLEGQIVNLNNIFRQRVEIDLKTGLILKVGKPTGKADVVLNQELVFPGFVDLHVHARECADHSQDYKEDFISASKAAINGGVVAFAEMPNNPVPPVDDASYQQKLSLAKKSAAQVVLYAALTPTSSPLSFLAPYKAFTSKSVGEIFFSTLGQLEAALEKYRGQNVSFHCEDPEIIRQNQNQLTHTLRRPPEAEISAIEFVLDLIEKYEIQGKICHLSTREGLQKILDAKKRGVRVTCEVTPHHLYFDGTSQLQMNPPLRQPEDRLALIEGLRNGQIDYLATDHAPHTLEEKQKGAPGLPHLDTFGPFATWLMEEHEFTPQAIARVCSFNPGGFFSQFSKIKYGRAQEGFAGSLTVIDLNQPVKIEKSTLKTKAGWSPFEGITFPGSVKTAIIRGKILKS